MALNLIMASAREELKPRITVFGVGGAGGNAVNNMIDKNLEGVEFVVANTDAQALQQSRATAKIQMGLKVTEGLGAGARPTVGAAAAEETIEEIVDHLAGAHMCFITAGMGGGTGTGAAPIIAQAARELGVLTVGVVTKPFQFEGNKRMKQAEDGIIALQKVVDTLIIIPNQNLFRLANERTTFTDAFAMADDVLYQGVKGVTDLMVRPGLINLDFADVRAVLDEISLHGAKGVLINITGGYDLTLFELDEAANIIREKVDPDANIIVGSTLDTSMEGTLRVSVVATGIDVGQNRAEMPATRRSMAQPLTQAAPIPEPKAAAPAPVQQPVAAQQYQAPAQDLFHTQHPSFHDHAEEMIEDDLPAPAYRPAQQAPVQQPRAQAPAPLSLDNDAGSFVAPRPRSAGTPSPEALARLQAAVSKSPSQAGAARQPAQQPQQRMAAPAPAPKPAERPRFGIGSLINRMAGGAAEQPQERPQSARQHPPVTAYDDEQELSADQERIEIPAFLRRQAN